MTPLEQQAVREMARVLNDIAQFFDGDVPLTPGALVSNNEQTIQTNVNDALALAFRAFGADELKGTKAPAPSEPDCESRFAALLLECIPGGIGQTRWESWKAEVFEALKDAGILKSADDLIASRVTPAVRVAMRFTSYNERRYSRPWIARVVKWPVGGKPELAFGRYVGDDKGGEVEMMAHVGDIVRVGQRDMRGNGGTNDWHVVEPNGTLRNITAVEARELFRQ